MTAPHIYRWDLDKTYLQTDFDSIGALLRTAFQRAAEKENVPGSAELLRLLRTESAGNSLIYFVSGSPRQMRGVLSEKLRLDGIHFDGFILKDNLKNLLKGRFRALRDQVGYKLPALLNARIEAQVESRETLFGDDAERDAFVYSMYGDLLAQRVPPEMLEAVLDLAGVYPDGREAIHSALDRLPPCDPVERIIIHLDRKSPPIRFEAYGSRVVPIYNYFQAALVLFEDGHLSAAAVARLAGALRDHHSFALPMLLRSFQDCLRRGVLSTKAAQSLGALSDGVGIRREILDAFAEEAGRMDGMRPEPADRVARAAFVPDYPELMRREQQRHAIDKARRKSLKRGWL